MGIPAASEAQWQKAGLVDIDGLRNSFTRLRRAKHIRQIDVAIQLGVKQAAISAWERGKSQTMRKDHIEAIAKLAQQWSDEPHVLRFGDARRVSHTDSHYSRKHSTEESQDAMEQILLESLASHLGREAAARIVASASSKRLLEAFLMARHLTETRD